MSDHYDFEKIENNWRDKWFENNIYKAEDFSKKPKKYILAELPYPSGDSLHLGHMMRYTVPEVYSRFLRMRGFNVLFPMGWDSFGLPAETYAIKRGITPQEAIKICVEGFKKSLQRMGYGIDWDREINTCDPNYYKWTQWTFIKLWENGLAQLSEMPVWWCKELGVLADEEVLPGPNNTKISERGGYPVEKKMYKQWVLKIPHYAEDLIKGLDQVSYTDSVKQGQINWIGKKVGANVLFELSSGFIVEVFTTRPDTLFGVSFLAISPEHVEIEKIIEFAANKKEIHEYIKKAKSLSDLERQTKEKTGVLIQGVYAKHPFEEVNLKIPVFIADYILATFGTGAIMGVPAHDERDYEFATKYDLRILPVVEFPSDHQLPFYEGAGKIINSGQYSGLSSNEFFEKSISLLEQKGRGSYKTNYKLRDQVFSRQRYWGEPIPLIYKQDGTVESVAFEDLPLELPIMQDFLPSENGDSPLKKNLDWINTFDSKGNPALRETDTMPTWAGSNWYFLRYIDPKNSEKLADFEKLKYWLPVDKYFGDAGHTTAHLLYARFWVRFLYNIGVVPTPEPFDFRMSGGMLLGADGSKMSKSRGNVIVPKDVLDNYGADAARTYLCFIGPYEETYPWNENGLIACYKLLRTIYNLRTKVVDVPVVKDDELNIALHKLIKNTTYMMEQLKMNTAVSEIMVFTNVLKKQNRIPLSIWKDFLKVYSPIAPFLTEELWQEANKFIEWKNENSIHLQDWPTFDDTLVVDKISKIPVQINGKLRGFVNVTSETSEDDIKNMINIEPSISKHLNNSKIERFIYIKNKIINIVTT